ncbi:hypothetical protein OAK75_02505 [Bacteriovoracales bacterium]|nr:hypothetical protein [Bacteriovoracales bacterium]
MNKIKKFIIFILFLQTGAFAKAPTYDTFEYLVKEFQNDIKKLPQKISSSVLLNISVKGNIHEKFKNHVRRSLEPLKGQSSNFKFKQCKECLILRADTIGKEIYLKKSITELKTIKKITKKHQVNSYAEVSLEKTWRKLIFKISFYQSKNSTLIWEKTYDTGLINLGNLNLTAAFEMKMGWQYEQPILLNVSIGEKVYGIGLFELNTTLGLASGSDYSGDPKVPNPNTSSVNNYLAVGTKMTFNMSEIFKLNTTWGSHLFYTEIGFCNYTRLKNSGDLKDPEGQWGLNFSIGYGVSIGKTFFLTSGIMAGLYLSTEDKGQRYPWLLNSGLGVRF